MVYMVRGDYASCSNSYLTKMRTHQENLVKNNSSIIMGTDFLYKEHCDKGNNSLFGVKDNEHNNTIHVNSAGLSQVGRDVAKHVVASGKIK